MLNQEQVTSLVEAIRQADSDGIYDMATITSWEHVQDALSDINDEEGTDYWIDDMEAVEVYKALYETFPVDAYAIQVRSMQTAGHQLLLYKDKSIAESFNAALLAGAEGEEAVAIERDACESADEVVEIDYRNVETATFPFDERKFHIVNPCNAHDVYGL